MMQLDNNKILDIAETTAAHVQQEIEKRPSRNPANKAMEVYMARAAIGLVATLLCNINDIAHYCNCRNDRETP